MVIEWKHHYNYLGIHQKEKTELQVLQLINKNHPLMFPLCSSTLLRFLHEEYFVHRVGSLVLAPE